MGGFVAKSRTYVRTASGVVRVDAGQPLPESADASRLERLKGLGLVEEHKPKPSSTTKEKG